MKKLIALLLVICMVAGLFVGCKKKTETPATDPTGTVATEATEAPDATDATGATEETEAPDATDETGATASTEAPDETEATQSGSDKKPTAATKNKTTKATTATKATAGKTTKATQAVATKATTPKATTAVNVNSPYKGKTIEIYGMSDVGPQDDKVMISNESTKIFPYIVKAAIVEWAEQNGVTIEFKGNYDQNAILAAINAGDKPDLIYETNVFPGISNNGITAAFSNAEYDKLADICGKDYLDLMQYGTKSHGFIFPWVGTYMLYYNATLFEEYGVKTPKEYFLEGNWNWDTYLDTLVAMTIDVDGDGTIDIYGSNNVDGVVKTLEMDSKGKMRNLADEPYMKAFFQLKYDAVTVKQCVGKSGAIQTNAQYPMRAMQISDCEPYNWQHLYQEISNGNIIEVAPVPVWEGENGQTFGQNHLTMTGMHLAATCDEREATVDLMAYILKCGLKYMSDYSLGTVDCEYEGLLGTSEYSKKILEALKTVNKNRTEKLEELGDRYDPEYMTKINKYLKTRGFYVGYQGTDIPSIRAYEEVTSMPPESSIPVIRNKHQAAVDAYNNTYLN